jgi:hypothetical protein
LRFFRWSESVCEDERGTTQAADRVAELHVDSNDGSVEEKRLARRRGELVRVSMVSRRVPMPDRGGRIRVIVGVLVVISSAGDVSLAVGPSVPRLRHERGHPA